MRHNFLTTIRRVSVLAAVAITAACSSDAVTSAPVAPTEGNAVLVSAVNSASGLVEATVRTAGHLVPLRRDLTVQATIGRAGGTLRIAETGFELVVPPGAVERNTTFKVTAVAGSALAYEFEPHGAKFRVPLKFRQSVLTTSIGWGQALRGGYFTDRSKLQTRNRTAAVAEQLPASIIGTWVQFDIWHFSGYLVSCA